MTAAAIILVDRVTCLHHVIYMAVHERLSGRYNGRCVYKEVEVAWYIITPFGNQQITKGE
jgi:hypothetical protein